MRREGLRTRDCHLLGAITAAQPELDIVVQSRAEPWPRLLLARRFGQDLPEKWRLQSPEPQVLPIHRDRRTWWVASNRYLEPLPPSDGLLVWNPLAGAATIANVPGSTAVVFDLLDDWSTHQAFRGIHDAVLEAYRQLLGRSDTVTTNSEATLALARRLGRSDAILIRNGCDPERFTREIDHHDEFTVGYGGKIGHRLDTSLIRRTAERFVDWRFEFAGPVLERATKQSLSGLPNVTFLGDVPYPRYPHVLRRWDLAWVPHRTGRGEVGGDVMKIYEYRAAGLPVVIPRIIGWERALPRVTVCATPDIPDTLAEIAGTAVPMQIARDHYVTPPSDTWRHKAHQLLELLGLEAS